MKLEDQVISLDAAKKLKDLGIIQDSIYWWDENDKEIYGSSDGSAKDLGCCSAYTVAELGIMLPEWVYSKLNSGGGEKWCCMMVESHVRIPKKIRLKDFYAKTESEARGAMLIHLLSKKILTIKKVNQRLQS